MARRLFPLLCAGMLAAAPAGAADTAAAACQARSAALIEALAQGDYAHAGKDFSAAVAQALDAGRLRQVWEQLQLQAGRYQSHGAAEWRAVAGRELAVTRVNFAGSALDMLVGCGADGRIETFRFVPAERAEAAPAAPLALPAGAQERPLQVASPLGPLPGVLTLPAGRGPFPAVLLVAGSGPQDRDETVGPNKPFRDLAVGLAQAGIATLRYDKRSYAYGMRTATDSRVTVDDEVTDDALAALKLLAAQPGVDARRVFVLGHSLGGLMAPRIVQRAPRAAGAILLAAPERFGIATLERQVRYIGQSGGAPQVALDAQLKSLAAARQAIDAADPAQPPAGRFAHAPASYWLSLRDYDAVETAKSLRAPLLVLQGEADYQVIPAEGLERWRAAFAGDPRVRVRAYPGLSHLFMPAGRPPGPGDLERPGHVDPAVIRDIAAWVAAQPPR
ncbi:alpha/beta hydrolase [Fulvimonas soli]|jgi:dienelactone hydrolase|uniref:Serine aminopeptidase S33 domain-containing protein n=1 Tax=Fulvimonas soli TaxID=155197 RepID=A0A316I5I6_9GAMM|nr:alpha/beta hydrolase [Fulvimonas soli]PWK87643.1 hypothetical protein C7456_106136 [Fulvimonas soli]